MKQWVGPHGSTTNPTYYYYDGWNLIQEGATAAKTDRVYVHGGRVDEIVASQAEEVVFHHYDARGHCIMLTDRAVRSANSTIMMRLGGRISTCHGQPLELLNLGNRFLFTGREWITDLKLYDYRNRMYQPELGRFLQPDPNQFEAGDYNLYRYCHNDPVNKSDPLGLNALFMVGGNRENPNYFTKIAETWAKKYEASHKGETASVVQVRTKADMANALKTNQNLDRVDYVRHSSSANLYLSDDGAGFISKRDIVRYSEQCRARCIDYVVRV